MDHARERLRLVAEWLPQAEKGLQARLATYKAFQEAAEVASDLVAMAMVDHGRPSKDDYSNFEAVAGLGLCDGALVPSLREATGPRNRLVHQYDGIETRRALDAMRRLLPALSSFLEGVTRWLRSSRA